MWGVIQDGVYVVGLTVLNMIVLETAIVMLSVWAGLTLGLASPAGLPCLDDRAVQAVACSRLAVRGPRSRHNIRYRTRRIYGSSYLLIIL